MVQMVTMQLRRVFLVATLVLVIAVGGEPQRCGPSSIDVRQTNTGKKVGTLDTMFQVTVTNKCQCPVKAIFLHADGFVSSVAVEPVLFRRAGAAGSLVDDGQQITTGKSITFQYACDHYFKMTPASFQAVC